jgi:phage baseplate assembly protein W
MASILFDYRFSLDKNAAKPYIYKDLNTDKKSSLQTTDKDIGSLTDIDAIRSGISNIFSYNQGERILLPDFGNSLYKYLYEPINNYTTESIGDEVVSMITKWEPRVKLHKVNVDSDPDNNEYRITIFYSVPTLASKIIQFNKVIKR